MQRAARLGYLIVVGFSCLIAALVIHRFDETAPLGSDWTLQISGEPSAAAAETMAALQRTAGEHRAGLIRVEADIQDPARTRHVYVLSSPPGSEPDRWLTGGYPGFARQVRTIIHPAAAASALDPRGDYFVFGDEAALNALRATITAQALESVSQSMADWGSITQWLMMQPLGHSVVVTAALGALLVGMSVIGDVRRYAVQRLHGASFGRLVWSDALATARFLAVTIPLVGVLFGVGLVAYAGGRQWQPVTLLALAFLAGLGAVLVVTHLVALGAASALAILESLKGRVMTSWGMAVVYGIRIPAAVLAIVSLYVFWAQVHQVLAYNQAAAAWGRIGMTAGINFNPRIGPEDQDRLAPLVGQWLLSEEAAGRAILSHKNENQRPGGGPPMLLVNNVYLARHDVLDPAGQPIRSGPADQVLVLLSPARQAQADTIRAEVEGALGLDGPVNIRIGQIQAGQNLFSYTSSRGKDLDAFITDPVVVVVNGPSNAIRPDNYMAMASTRGMLVTDPEIAARTAADHGVSSFIIGYRPVAQEAARVLANEIRELWVTATSLVTAAIVLLATALGSAALYTRATYQQTFLRYISGWSFTRTHRVLLGIETGITLVLVGFAYWYDLPSFGKLASTGWFLPSAVALAVLNFGFIAAALAFNTRRLVRHRSSEA